MFPKICRYSIFRQCIITRKGNKLYHACIKWTTKLTEEAEPFNSPIISFLYQNTKNPHPPGCWKQNTRTSEIQKTRQSPTFPANLLFIYWISIVQQPKNFWLSPITKYNISMKNKTDPANTKTTKPQIWGKTWTRKCWNYLTKALTHKK